MLDGSIVDIAEASNGRISPDIHAFLSAGDSAFDEVRRLLDDPPTNAIHSVSDIRICAPVPRPGKIIALARNYAAHATEGGAEPPDRPNVFAKYTNTVTGPYDPIILPGVSEQVDYEAELAVVLGRRCKHVPQDEALRMVAGYTIANDVSVRDYQKMVSQFTLGKTFDTHCPMGPVLLTADEVPDPQALDLRCSIDGIVLQEGNTSEMVFGVAYMIAYLSEIMTLEPGDVILTGTPSGVGMWRNPPRWILPGEKVRVDIPQIGHIENQAVVEVDAGDGVTKISTTLD
jgi:2-keto-4-pentenoate hydratase/2-oxohepta-3-ene-1,7-dioic acid hydratase in catechol pathway